MKIDWTKVGAWLAANKRHFVAAVVVLFCGTLMFAGSVEGEPEASIRQALVEAGKWLLRNRLLVGFVLLVVGLVAVYVPWSWFDKNIVKGWSWRVAGCYTVGLLFGTAAMITTLWLGDGLAWTRVVAVMYFFAIAGLSALAAHWRATWTAPSFAYLGWVAVLMLIVPAWVAITQLATKI
jgi:predicted MFS family arabinose efflux permease